MKPILTPGSAIEFSYDEQSKHSYFEVAFVRFGTEKRVARKLPLSVSSADLCAAVSETIASAKSPASPTAEMLMWQCSIYEKNIYYLRTLLHDAKLQAFVVWLLEWYVRSFALSLTVLLENKRTEMIAALPPNIPEVLRSVLAGLGASTGEVQRDGG